MAAVAAALEILSILVMGPPKSLLESNPGTGLAHLVAEAEVGVAADVVVAVVIVAACMLLAALIAGFDHESGWHG